MITRKIYNVIGIMSGTSMDGIDLCFARTNGINYFKVKCENSYTYSIRFKKELKKTINIINKKKKLKEFNLDKIDKLVTNTTIKIIKKFIKEKGIKFKLIDFIGYSGQTIYHNPKNNISIQLGSCESIRKNLNIKVIGKFREKDIDYGGQGAPIAVYYHAYLIKKLFYSSAIINLGGISNISFLKDKKLNAFDIGPANSIIDDLMLFFFKKNFDKNGKIAIKGKKNKKIYNLFKKDKYFRLNYPKSLDREYFRKYTVKLKKINKYDAVHTASLMTIDSILYSIKKIKKHFNNIILTGGGRKNIYIINNLRKKLENNNINLKLIDDYNLNGDLLEAQAFAYICIRSLKKLTISSPTTTGVKKNISGGKLYC